MARPADKDHKPDGEPLVINVGPYWVETRKEQLLGRGGYGSVYRGVHNGTRQFVAVKIFHDQSDDETVKREIAVYEQTSTCDSHAPFAKLL